MLSVRNAILAALVVFVLAIAGNVISLLRPPDSNGKAVDSYGTQREGYRAAFELLSMLGVPVERQIAPPSNDLSTSSTLVLWLPHEDLVRNEPAYLERMLPWVERGGRLVVGLASPASTDGMRALQMMMTTSQSDVLSVLDLDGIRPTEIVLNSSQEDDAPSPKEILRSRDARREHLRRTLTKSLMGEAVKFTTVQASLSGVFETSKDRIQKLQVPEAKVGGLKIKDSVIASGKIDCTSPEGESWTIVVAVPRGKGEIVVVAEPLLLMNGSLAEQDNAVLTVDLLSRDGGQVVFDEFYHGLSVRGNPMWLLTRRTYATVILTIVGILGLALWRRAILLGPPLDAKLKTRRSIIEYIEAMARFLNRGRGSRSFLLHEIRDGALRITGDRWGLPPGDRNIESIAAKMARRSPADAEAFRQSIQTLDQAIAKGSSLSESEAIRAMQRISPCL